MEASARFHPYLWQRRIVVGEMEVGQQILQNLGNAIAKLTATIERSLPRKDIQYYINQAVTYATPTQPISREVFATASSAGYDRIQVRKDISRNADEFQVINEGPGSLYLLYTTDYQNWTQNEIKIDEGKNTVLNNVYELRVRAPRATCTYTATEYIQTTFKNMDFKAGMQYIENRTITTGNTDPATAYTTADTHSVNSSLTKNATTGYVKNRDNSATLFMWISLDGTNYDPRGVGLGVAYASIQPNSALNIDGGEVYSIKVGADSNGINYEVFLA